MECKVTGNQACAFICLFTGGLGLPPQCNGRACQPLCPGYDWVAVCTHQVLWVLYIRVTQILLDLFSVPHYTLFDKALKKIKHFIKLSGAGEMVQSVKCILSKHEDLTLDLQCSCKKLGTAVNIYNLNTEEAEAGGSLELVGQLPK